MILMAMLELLGDYRPMVLGDGAAGARVAVAGRV